MKPNSTFVNKKTAFSSFFSSKNKKRIDGFFILFLETSSAAPQQRRHSGVFSSLSSFFFFLSGHTQTRAKKKMKKKVNRYNSMKGEEATDEKERKKRTQAHLGQTAMPPLQRRTRHVESEAQFVEGAPHVRSQRRHFSSQLRHVLQPHVPISLHDALRAATAVLNSGVDHFLV